MIKKPHKRLSVWQKSIELTKQIYNITEKFSQKE
ncbi:MAG: four helix bundle protein [Elusimicrobia bacterium]|nr:four helix bundle protein [Elusimicrobiota bacterium]